MSSHRRKLLLYAAISALTVIAAGVTPGMFGDGSLSWAQFRYEWAKVALGACLGVATTLKAFYSDPEKEERLPPDAQASLARLDELAAWNESDKPA